MDIKVKLSSGNWGKSEYIVKKQLKGVWFTSSDKRQKAKKKVNGKWVDNF